MHTKLENPKGRDHLGNLGIDGKMMIGLKEGGMRVWTGFFWLRIGTSSRFL
jgi:hypothetical protein